MVQAGSEVCEAAIASLGLDDEIRIAVYNTPLLTVLAGNVDAVEVLEAHLIASGVRIKILEASHAIPPTPHGWGSA